MSKPISREGDNFADRLHDELIDKGMADCTHGKNPQEYCGPCELATLNGEHPISQQAARALLGAARLTMENLWDHSDIWEYGGSTVSALYKLREAIALAEKEGSE